MEVQGQIAVQMEAMELTVVEMVQVTPTVVLITEEVRFKIMKIANYN